MTRWQQWLVCIALMLAGAACMGYSLAHWGIADPTREGIAIVLCIVFETAFAVTAYKFGIKLKPFQFIDEKEA